jgi:hypothetical protein
MAESLPIITATARRYFAGAADLTIRKRLMLSLLSKNGRISYNNNGETVYWNVEFDQPPVQSHGASGEYDFSEPDWYKQLSIDVRGYVATNKLDYKNSLMNKGDVAIVNYYDRIMPTLKKSLDDNFHAELYIDGYATGNGNRLHGVNSFLGDDGATVAADIVARPSDTYGGLSTAPAGIAGTWSTDLGSGNYPNATIATDWPDGKGSTPYDFMSPVLANFTSSEWGTGSVLWEDNCARVLRRVTTWLTKNGGSDGRPTCFLLASNLFNSYQDYQETKFRNIIPHPEARDLGFPDTLNQDGVMVKFEFDTTANQGYVMNIHQMELASWDSVLFGTRGPTYDIKSDAYLFKAGFFGNCRYSPKFFGKLKAYA